MREVSGFSHELAQRQQVVRCVQLDNLFGFRKLLQHGIIKAFV